MSQKQPEPVWSERDSALWHTCDLVADLAAGRPPERLLDVLTPFPPQFAADEVGWAAGPYELLEHAAPGDGRYVQDRGFFFATGPVGLAATAALALGRAAGNSSRRRTAEAQAVRRWMPTDSGTLYVSAYGISMHATGGLYPWAWHSIRTASMVGPGAMHITGESNRGPVSWIVRSDWAELAFVTWALAIHPRHPQLLSGAWLPQGWLEWAAGHYRSRLSDPVIAIGR